MSMIAVAGMLIIVAVISLCVCFLPTLIAYIKGNMYKKQVLIYQILMVAARVGIAIVCGVISIVFPYITILNVVWAIISFVIWIYILVNAIKNTRMTLLDCLGINI